MRFSITKHAAMTVMEKSKEASMTLTNNMTLMDWRVNQQFIGLKDPAFISYLELSMQMQDIIKQISGKMEAITEYCQKCLDWMNKYSDM